MAALLHDASGIVKRYVQEVGARWVQGLTHPATGHEIFLTRIACVEVTAALSRRGRGNTGGGSVSAILAQFRHDARHQYNNILEITPLLLIEAERLAEVHALRGYDAVQLAVTVHVHQSRVAAGLTSLTLISADGELNTAAQGRKTDRGKSQ